MKFIPLTKNQFALVDDESFDYLNQWKWKLDSKGYAVRQTSRKLPPRKNIYMHREIVKTPEGMFTDHKNFNRLDNRKENLRICTKRQNQIHQFNSRNKTGYRGISWNERDKAWVVQISTELGIVKRKQVKDKELAIQIYKELSKEYYGEFAV